MTPLISTNHQRYLVMMSIAMVWGTYCCSFSASRASLVLALITSLYFFAVTVYWLASSLKQGKIILPLVSNWLGKIKKLMAVLFMGLIISSLNFFGVYYGLASAYTQLVADKHEVIGIIKDKHPGGGIYSTFTVDIVISGKTYSDVRVPASFYKSIRIGNVLSVQMKESWLGAEFYFR